MSTGKAHRAGAAVLFCGLFLFSLLYYHQFLGDLRFTIYQERDIFRAYDIFHRKIGLFYGPDTIGGGLLPGPFYYFMISLGTFFTDYARSSYFVMLVMQALFVALLGLYFLRTWGTVACAAALSLVFLTAYPTNQYIKFFNPSYLPLFLLGAILLLARLLDHRQERPALVAFAFGCVSGAGVQVHGQMGYFLLIAPFLLAVYKEKRLSVYLALFAGLLAPSAAIWLFYAVSGRQIVYPPLFFFTGADFAHILDTSGGSSRYFRMLAPKTMDFFGYFFPLALFAFWRGKKELLRKQSTLMVASLALAAVSFFGLRKYIVSGSETRYAQMAHFAFLLITSVSLGHYFRGKSAKAKAVACVAIVAVSWLSFALRPQFLRDDPSFADIGLKRMLYVYNSAKNLSGADGRALSAKIFVLNIDEELLAFKAFSAFRGGEVFPAGATGPRNPSVGFFLYHNDEGKEYTSEWLGKELPSFLPPVIREAIRGKEITPLPALVYGDIWLIPFLPAAGGRYPAGFTNHFFGYFSEGDEAFLKNEAVEGSKILRNTAAVKEAKFQWRLCGHVFREYCLVNETIAVGSGREPRLDLELNGAGVSNNPFFGKGWTLLLRDISVSLGCKDGERTVRAFEFLGPLDGRRSYYHENISAPLRMRLRSPCAAGSLTYLRASFRYTTRSSPEEWKEAQLEARF